MRNDRKRDYRGNRKIKIVTVQDYVYYNCIFKNFLYLAVETLAFLQTARYCKILNIQLIKESYTVTFYKLKLKNGSCKITKVYNAASIACIIFPITYGFIESFSLDTTLNI